VSSLTKRLRGLAALGVILSLAACAPQSADARPKAAAAAQVPEGFEVLEAVTAKGTTRFLVEIADSPAERERGLMFRESLAPDRGMLFDFQRTQPELAFWMKNTLIPLDIIYIRADGTVLSIARNATPLSEVPIPSGGPALGVLEIAGGRAAEIGLRPGDRIRHRIFKGG
jgi:uncharacterized membrane protein (UPF0127 family)